MFRTMDVMLMYFVSTIDMHACYTVVKIELMYY